MTAPQPGGRVTITHAPGGLRVATLVVRWGRSASLAADNYALGVSRIDLGCWCVISGIGASRWGPGR